MRALEELISLLNSYNDDRRYQNDLEIDKDDTFDNTDISYPWKPKSNKNASLPI
jgi:hypothetical protein